MSQKTITRDQVRESILDAMDRLLARFGYQKTTVDDLASEAGIGKGTIYLYFSSKEQVALSCLDRLHERLLAKMEAASSGPGAAEQRIADVLVERVIGRLEYCRNATSIDEMLAALHKELVVRKQGYYSKEADLLERLLEQAAASGDLPRCDSQCAAETMISATNSFLPYSLRGADLGSSEAVEKKVRRVAALLVLGLSGLPRCS